MTDYDELFAATASETSVFAEKRALDPLTDPDEIVSRETQERDLATILNGVDEGYLPPTVSIYGPPGTGKTLTTRRVCQAFADRHDDVAVEYVNLKECRTLFSAANEILAELTGAKKRAYEGLDGVFEAIWDALEDYPAWTIFLLDEIDQITHDTNYNPNEFFYRLLRGEGKRRRGIDLSVWVVSNQLLEVDLRLDSRVQSAMSDDQVFFPPYGVDELEAILAPRIERAFQEGTISPATIEYGVSEAARRWGDARKALTLVRRAGEQANERGLERVTRACFDANLGATDREVTTEKLLALPVNHFLVLVGATGMNRHGEIKQPVTTAEIHRTLESSALATQLDLSKRTIRTTITDLETMGLVETWIDSRGRDGRVKQIETTFEPQWVRDVLGTYLADSAYLDGWSLREE
ncbi:Cdc6/Cdc18 family protein [Halovivax gelatinilyticus]|uniref:Cdc6/Cdc18 family protein n=1 Tax=Halovivax gelatinilyticus TaxID=2961597 RepID=UPI0020CA51F5|nr:AAA family ATPase [Halovivax gelatinilyticus]